MYSQKFTLAFRADSRYDKCGDYMKEFLSAHMDPKELQQLSMLALAHVGDGVYELMVRTRLCTLGLATAKTLHRETVNRVRAPAQAQAAEILLPLMTEEEQDVYRRGRNAKVNAIPKGADPKEYHAATALEALFGYLYLSGRNERLEELFQSICETLPNF